MNDRRGEEPTKQKQGLQVGQERPKKIFGPLRTTIIIIITATQRLGRINILTLMGHPAASQPTSSTRKEEEIAGIRLEPPISAGEETR